MLNYYLQDNDLIPTSVEVKHQNISVVVSNLGDWVLESGSSELTCLSVSQAAKMWAEVRQ